MISFLANKLALYIADGDQSADVEVLAYGYDIFLQKVFIIFISLLIALPFGLLWHVLLSIILFEPLRKQAGGCHAKYSYVCIITSVVMMFGPSYFFAKTTFYLPIPAIVLIYCADLYILLRHSPAGTEIRPINDKQLAGKMRRNAVIILSIYFVISLSINAWRPDFSSLISVMSTIVCLMVHPWVYKAYGCNRGDEVTA